MPDLFAQSRTWPRSWLDHGPMLCGVTLQASAVGRQPTLDSVFDGLNELFLLYVF
jgi:hypothetical protein